ncbi:uncharacterized protein LOC131664688 [Phymastichus coffea]|uniref:uncharacterized protein LOC131664688 n=1 Tax=Phymastichus coffea TaxID=108790 RepID=UPI00273C091E|nr:uncharacterized protein LOC131664688 [Phymastichus coffea]
MDERSNSQAKSLPQQQRHGSGNLELGQLMQHLHARQLKAVQSPANPLALNTNDSQRVFPFQSTPSGNLKIIPNQVVFESKKVSVLVASPRHAKVDVKAEQRLPPSVTVSTLERLQAQLAPSSADRQQPEQQQQQQRPRTQPHSRAAKNSGDARERPAQMLPRHEAADAAANSASQHEADARGVNEVALASLGFTAEQPIDWQNIALPEKTDLYRELHRRITTYTNADCIVRIADDEFHCHLLVLQSYSTFFDERNVKEIELSGSSVTSAAFSIIYDWMISPTSESCHLLRRDNILEIFRAAQHLGIKELEEQCWAFIDNDELFSEDTAFLLYLEARKAGNTAVMELMVPRIMKFFLMLVSTRDFLQLTVDELCLLLRSNYICVNSEMEVLMSAVRWLMYDWEGRKQYLLEVMKCVRFGLIAPWQLVDVKRNPENPEFMELMSYPEIQKMVDDGLAFVIIKYWYGNQTEDYYHWIDLLGLTEPTNRNWAGEDKHYVTYREFLLYLEEYQRTKLLALKNKKSHAKPSPPSSPPKENSSPQTTPLVFRKRTTSHQNSKVAEIASMTANARPSKNPTEASASNVPPCMMMSPEILQQYLDSMGRNSSKLVSKSTNGISRPKHSALSNLPTKFMSMKCVEEKQKRPSDSSNSQEEAATTAQAVYRGYKGRTKVAQIKRGGSENTATRTKRVMDLLTTPVGQSLHKPLEPIKFASCPAAAARQRSESPADKETALGETIAVPSVIADQDRRLDNRVTKTFVDLEQKTQMSEDESTENGSLIKTVMSPAHFSTDDKSSITPRDSMDEAAGAAAAAAAASTTAGLTSNVEVRARKKTKDSLLQQLSKFERRGSSTLRRKSRAKEKEAVLVFGGIDPHDERQRQQRGAEVLAYRRRHGWRLVAEMPQPRHHHSLAYLAGRVYLAGGSNPRDDAIHKSVALGTAWSYDPRARSWRSEADMLTCRQNFGLVASDGKIFAIGGQSSDGLALKTVEAFDPLAGEWTVRRSMRIARIGPATVKYDARIWVAGGMTNSSREPITRDVECYNAIANVWYVMEPLLSPRCFSCLHVVADRLFIIGGASETCTKSSIESVGYIDVWDVSRCSWQRYTQLRTARHGHAVSSIGNQLLVMGGVTTKYTKALKSVECYCFAQDNWTRGISSLPLAISGHGTVSLPLTNILDKSSQSKNYTDGE